MHVRHPVVQWKVPCLNSHMPAHTVPFPDRADLNYCKVPKTAYHSLEDASHTPPQLPHKMPATALSVRHCAVHLQYLPVYFHRQDYPLNHAVLKETTPLLPPTAFYHKHTFPGKNRSTHSITQADCHSPAHRKP